jgi:hypothetical protein
MTTPPLPSAPRPGRSIRIEYLGFQNVDEHREFRLRAHGPDGPTEFRLRIAIAAFGAGGVRLQDGPDVCYQKVLRAVTAGETASPDVITLDEAELATYRKAHTQVPKHRSWTAPAPVEPVEAAAVTDTPPVTQDTEPAP